MSRFYEALKQASRTLHQGPDEDPDVTALLNGSGADIMPAPEVVAFPGNDEHSQKLEDINGAAPWDAGLEFPEMPPVPPLSFTNPVVSQPATPPKQQQNGFFGTLIDAVLDKKARLIPNSVEPTL